MHPMAGISLFVLNGQDPVWEIMTSLSPILLCQHASSPSPALLCSRRRVPPPPCRSPIPFRRPPFTEPSYVYVLFHPSHRPARTIASPRDWSGLEIHLLADKGSWSGARQEGMTKNDGNANKKLKIAIIHPDLGIGQSLSFVSFLVTRSRDFSFSN